MKHVCADRAFVSSISIDCDDTARRIAQRGADAVVTVEPLVNANGARRALFGDGGGTQHISTALPTKLTVVGDLHGQLRDLVEVGLVW